MKPVRVLLVSSHPHASLLFRGLLEPCVSLDLELVSSERAALSRVEKATDLNLVIHDQSVPLMTNAGFVGRCKRIAPNIPLITLRPEGTGSSEGGAEDFSLSVDEISSRFGTILKQLFVDSQSSDTIGGLSLEYCPVRIEVLKFVGNSPVDLFLRLNDEKYLKVLNQSDPFLEIDVDRFHQKGMEVLFIERSQYEVFSKALEQSLTRLSGTEKLGVAGSLQHCAGELYQELGFSPELEKTVQQTLNTVMQAVQSRTDLKELLERALERPGDYRATHAIACAYVAVGLLEPLEWDKDQNALKLTLASLLHDLPISKSSLAHFHHPNEVTAARNVDPTITDEDIQEFKMHPERSKLLAEQLYPTLSDVGTILVQHHELPDGTGFPKGIYAPQIAPLSSLFIVAHKIVEFWMNRPDFKMSEFIEKNREEFSAGSFRRIVQVLQSEP